MAGDDMIRASDRDRDAVAATLREAYTAGRLTLDEFTQRTGQAFEAKTWGQLRALTADLPQQPPLGADLPADSQAVPPGQGPPGQGPAPTAPVTEGPGHRRQPPPPYLAPRPVRPPERPRGWAPVAMVWVLLVLITHPPAPVAVPMMVLAFLLLFTSLSRRR